MSSGRLEKNVVSLYIDFFYIRGLVIFCLIIIINNNAIKRCTYFYAFCQLIEI